MHLLLYASIVLTASALNIPLQPRSECGDTQDQLVYNDGPTADGTAGIGAEFESLGFKLVNKDCSLKDTNDAKKSLIEGRKGLNWELTADSTGAAGELQAEYILDGRNIKVGSEDGAKAGKAIADDLINWAPWKGDGPKKTLKIDNNKCNPWDIDVNRNTKPEQLPWFPQITASMPLEALYSLMEENLANPLEKNILDGTNYRSTQNKLVLVKKDYFQSKPNNIDASTITNDVLAFCTLVLSFAKAATETLMRDQSPKLSITFMPRTEFNTMFQIVKPKLTGDLFSLFNTLACYKTDKSGNVVLDTGYCKGTMSNPVPGDKFSGLKYTNTAPKPEVSVNIKDWIQGIGKADPSPDLLSKFDQSVDGSIGGLGTQMEKMYNSQRAAPLIEFRDLDDKKTNEIEQFMKDVDSAIQKLHKDFADAPTKKKRDVLSCTPPNNITQSAPPTPPNPPVIPSVVVAPVNPPSQPSCVPNPTDSVKNAHESELKKAVEFFCHEHATETNRTAPIKNEAAIIVGIKPLGRNPADVAYVYPENSGNQDDVYDFSLTSVGNCTPLNGFNLASPVANSSCTNILYNAWKNCDNQGRGGQITAGCLTYSVKTRY